MTFIASERRYAGTNAESLKVVVAAARPA